MDELEAMRRKKAAKKDVPSRSMFDVLYKDTCCMECAEAVDNESEAFRHHIMTGHKKFMPRFLVEPKEGE